MTFWTTKTFKALQQEWYERLKAAGFQDAEKVSGSQQVLKRKSREIYRSTDELMRETKERYFEMLALFIAETAFPDDVDKTIMLWHADGQKIKCICEELERQGNGRCRNTITFTIRKYEMAWGMRRYTRKQLNRRE